MKKTILIAIILSIFCCKSSKIEEPKISLKDIQKKGAIIYKNKVDNYSKYFPYYYLNRDKRHLRTKGDYYKLTHPEGLDVNLIVGFVKNYGIFKNDLRAQVWINTKSKKDLENLKIKIYSEKNGVINFRSNYNRIRQETFWIEKIYAKQMNEKNNFLNSLSDDKIYLEINGYKYTFIAPKVSF